MARQTTKSAKAGPLVSTPAWVVLRHRLWKMALALQMNEKPSQGLRDEICDLLHWFYDKPKALQALFDAKKGAKGHGAPSAMAVCYLLHLEAETAAGTLTRLCKGNAIDKVAAGWSKSPAYVKNQISKHRELAELVIESAEFLPKLRKAHAGQIDRTQYAAAVRKLAIEIEGTFPTLAGRQGDGSL
jgi:hypothetical protein